jgi:hypothetical protein
MAIARVWFTNSLVDGPRSRADSPPQEFSEISGVIALAVFALSKYMGRRGKSD